MINVYLSTNEIAKLLGCTKGNIIQRAQKEKWLPYKTVSVRGGQERQYHLRALPQDIQMAYCASIKKPFADLQRELEPGLIFTKKVVVNRYSCRSRPGREVKAFAQVCKKGRQKAQLRVKVIDAWSASELSPEEFAKQYNEPFPKLFLRDRKVAQVF